MILSILQWLLTKSFMQGNPFKKTLNVDPMSCLFQCEKNLYELYPREIQQYFVLVLYLGNALNGVLCLNNFMIFEWSRANKKYDKHTTYKN